MVVVACRNALAFFEELKERRQIIETRDGPPSLRKAVALEHGANFRPSLCVFSQYDLGTQLIIDIKRRNEELGRSFDQPAGEFTHRHLLSRSIYFLEIIDAIEF